MVVSEADKSGIAIDVAGSRPAALNIAVTYYRIPQIVDDFKRSITPKNTVGEGGGRSITDKAASRIVCANRAIGEGGGRVIAENSAALV